MSSDETPDWVLDDQPPDSVYDNDPEAVPTATDAVVHLTDFAEKIRAALLYGDAIGTLPPPEYLIDRVLPARAVSELYGPSGHAKSLIVLGMCGAIVRGRAWHGHAVRRGTVVYIAAEGASGQDARWRAYKLHYRVTDDLQNLVWLPMAVNLSVWSEVGALIDVLAEIEPDLVVVDTRARNTLGVEENSAKDMGIVVASCDRIVA